MSEDSRRKLLKGLAVTLPAAWSRPVVDAVILPAHAQTSAPETAQQCGAEPGCYTFEGEGPLSFSWQGGLGPYEVTAYESDNCTGEVFQNYAVVVAANLEAASDLIDSPCIVEELENVSPSPGGCSFFACPVRGPGEPPFL